MKKLGLALIIIVLITVSAFAQDIRVQDTKNWEPFFAKNGNTFSYWHENGKPTVAYLGYNKKTPGYLYFYVKIDPGQEFRDEMQKDFSEKHPKKFEGVRFARVMTLVRIHGKDNTIGTVHEYVFSDTNDLILDYDVNDPPTPLKGSIYEQIPFDKDRLKRVKQDADLRDKNDALLKKFGVEKIVGINLLEVNPYEFEGHIIAVQVQFQKMFSKSSAIFFSGYTNLSESTGVPDQIIVTGIPKGTHFKSGFMAPRMVLALRGKGTIAGTNAFGAKIKAPHFEWIGIISGEQKSVFEEQRDNSRQDALRNAEQSRKIKNR